MKSILLVVVSFCIYTTSFAQDLTYTGPGKGEVHSFWINAMAIKKTGKIEEGILKMEAKLVEVKKEAPNYNTADMVAEIKKWKDKLAASANTTAAPTATTQANTVAAPQSIVNIKDLTVTNATPNYAGPGKMYVTNYYKQAEDAKKNIEKQAFSTAQNKIEQMGNSLEKIKTKDPSYNTTAMEAEVKNFKAAMETEKYNLEKGKVEGDNKAANEQAAYKILGEIFGMQNLDFRSDEFPLRAMIVQKHKASMESYLSLTTKASAATLEGFRKKNTDFFLTHTNMTLKKIENFVPTATGTDWVEGIYYSLQYHQSLWNAAQKIYPTETEFADMYKKVTTMVDKLGSMEKMKGKGSAAELAVIKNRKLPVSNVKDTKLEKVLTDGFNNSFGTKATALKAVLVQNGWTTLRNSISGIVTGRERSAKLAYKSKDGKCYLLEDYIFIREEYIGNSFTNTKAIFNGLFGQEMLCENVN
jgi:hypothetical protein